MAKNKNSRKQSSPQDRASQQAEKSGSFDTESQVQSPPQGSPADVARKHQKRFGHN
ncbi:hypothetical protein [Streptomyces candidus]|uniref:Small hydrophilic protein n=1 Tax=Streptomyces candidus TaxID=67283 RepID=A0A7X0LLV1_9ACTN|nr:hypothetical protein [Streptomyces candidus]MBB6433708.1 hypothetical protein [Streptomyces candidus]GHH34896.1 hypothetical protein GCM10018773_07720 [Streptomyces candidus]